MTIKEAILTELYPYNGAPDAIVIKAMIDTDSAIDGTVEYGADKKQFVYRAAFAALRSMLSITGVGEGDYKMDYDPDGLREKMRAIAKISGDQGLIDEVAVTVPTISAPAVW